MKRVEPRSMRARYPFSALSVVLVGAACAHEDRRPAQGPLEPASRSAPPPIAVQYIVADPGGPSKSGILPIALGTPGAYGIVADKRRTVVGQGDARVARDMTSDPIVGALRLPARLGTGFLFWTSRAIYRADAFDSALLPVVEVPDAIDAVSFAPKSLFVRTHNGERWALGLPNGERMAIAPLGVVDVQALDDGRAVAFDDQGAAFTSLDSGAHWADVTAQLKSSPARAAIVGADLWLVDSTGGGSRLEHDGRLSWFDKGPPDTYPDVRPKDPRWHGTDTPLRAVFHAGASVDESTGIVLEGGDVVRVDLRTGEIASIVAGRLPPDAVCEAVPIVGDVLFACAARQGASAFVVSRTLSSEAPVIEQTLAGGGVFYASDDGGLAYPSPCSGVTPAPNTPPTVCVRMPGGRWEDRDLSGILVDGGPIDANVARWVPRADGRVVAIIVEPVAGIYDPGTASFQPIDDEAKDVVGRTPSYFRVGYPSKSSSGTRVRKRMTGTGLVDSSWSFGSGNTLRGWQRRAESVELSEDGKVVRSPFALDIIYAGSSGLGRSKDGRLYQSVDHGGSWLEVAAPPSGIEATDLVACSSAGCDLGAFYRIGWAERAPGIEPPKSPAPAAPSVRRIRGLELGCRPSGSITSKLLPRTSESPEDLGLGNARLPVAGERTDYAYLRNVVTKSIVSPVHDVPDGNGGEGPSLRAVFSGYSTTTDGAVLAVAGPNRSALALRRNFAYAPPFDPLGRVVRTSIAMSDVVAAGRRAGMTPDEVLAEDATETGLIVPLTPPDPTAPADVAAHNIDRGFLSIVRGDRVRVTLHASQNTASIVSGVILPGGDESAFLEVDSSGNGHVFKVTATGPADLFDVTPTTSDTAYPANPDALAIGPRGELAILRTPSGSEPPSPLDPAFLVVPATPPSPLAPWTELKLADDPACKSEPGGYRATIQAIGPWIRVTTPELRVADDSPMLARVRWTSKRICLEAFEVKLPSASIRTPASTEPIAFATWLVAKGSTFSRVALSEGIEWRQPLECTLAPGPH